MSRKRTNFGRMDVLDEQQFVDFMLELEEAEKRGRLLEKNELKKKILTLPRYKQTNGRLGFLFTYESFNKLFKQS